MIKLRRPIRMAALSATGSNVAESVEMAESGLG
jgi:hypothetical protein